MRYPALIEGGGSDYGIWFPDIDGIGAMGYTIEEVLANASEVLSDYAIEMEKDGLPLAAPSALEDVEVPEGCALTTILLVREARDKPSVRLNLVLDAGVADAIASEARRRGMSRKSYIEWMTKTIARMGA
jgi:predicted RNase H-like HicB family nuclease